MNRTTRTNALSALAGIVGFACPLGALSASIDFQSQILPVLQANCFKCHGEEKQKGKLRLDTLSADLAADRVAAERWHDVRDALNLGEMPPQEESELPAEDRQLLVSWLSFLL